MNRNRSSVRHLARDTANQNSTAKSTVAVGDSFRITVSYAFVEGPNDKGNYVDAHDADWTSWPYCPQLLWQQRHLYR
jgi:hypothetical protein